MANKLNGSTKWIALALAIAGSVVTLTLAFSEKASKTRMNATCERLTAVETSVVEQDKRLERIENKIDRLLERGK